MAILPTRSSADVNASADINELSTKAEDKQALTAKGDLYVATASGVTSRLAIGTNDQVLTADSAETEGVKWSTPSVDNPLSSAKSADYTILDGDGISVILMTVGSSTDKTVTLPTATDNTDREITVIKADTGTNKLIVDGEGSETINGNTTINLISQYDRLKIKCDGSGWIVLDSHITLESAWVSLATWTGQTINIGHNFGVGIDGFNFRVLWSTSGATGSDNYELAYNSIQDTVGNNYGMTIKNVDTNTLQFITGTAGAIIMSSGGGYNPITSGYYKVILKRIL